MSDRANLARNAVGGVLWGYGLTAFACFFYLDWTWFHGAPADPDIAAGLIYSHDEHGVVRYLSAFQSTACALMFATSIPLAFVGFFIMPKKNIKGTVRWYAARFTFDQDDPRGLSKWSSIASAVLTPFLVFGAGPYLIHALNDLGFVLHNP
jgi:hypothetical protein